MQKGLKFEYPIRPKYSQNNRGHEDRNFYRKRKFQDYTQIIS